MKKKFVVFALCIAMAGLCACGAEEKLPEDITGEPISMTESSVGEKTGAEDGAAASASEENGAASRLEQVLGGIVVIDFNHDFTADVQADVDAVVEATATVQDEWNAINKVAEKYEPLAKAAATQAEMNKAASWFYALWDQELNNLWGRISKQADDQTKERLLADQRNWVAMKEEVTIEYLGREEDGGSIYPQLKFGFWEEITKNRVAILANELAKIQGEAFSMPERTSNYGVYVDNEGTGSVYSSLITRRSWENADEAMISLYRTGTLEGTFKDLGNGTLEFVSYDEKIRGIITLNGWNGASFKVTSCDGDAIVSVGDEYEFNFVF